MKRPLKGAYGYLDSQRKIEIGKTVLIFSISFAVYIIGYLSMGTSKNLLTVVAVLGMLPASKSAVSMIMFLRFPSRGRDVCEETASRAGMLPAVYDMVITTRDKSYPLYAAVCAGQTLCGFTGYPKADTKRMEEHILNLLRSNGHLKTAVKIFDDKKQYFNRVDDLREKYEDAVSKDGAAENRILDLLLALSI